MAGADNSKPKTSGFIVLDKPEGLSSMTAIAILRRKAGGVKTGHAGTLDPLATGVLVAAVGRATKSISRVMDTTKRYRTRIDLGAFTETDDREADRVEVATDDPPDLDRIEGALEGMRGTHLQPPPAYSAMKVGGRRAYQLARQGRPVPVAPRQVTAHSVEVLEYRGPELELELHVDKGFYVRSLARMLGEALGTGGHCLAIRRTAVGPFDLSMAHDPEALEDPLPLDLLIGVDDALVLLDG
ncbi:MAG: tRNA pseudouridine(55) synthase TruB [Planctomycetota bacterium]|nr:tRNA pseudouridine(55) synthase TruB [Planctomycetota bacterium]